MSICSPNILAALGYARLEWPSQRGGNNATMGARGLRLRAIVSASFADIFFSNCTKIGLLPVVLPEDEVRALMAAGDAEVDLEALEVRFDGRAVPFSLDAERRRRLLEGLDDIALTLQQEERIAAYEAERERTGPVTTAL